MKKMREKGLRVEMDNRSEKIGRKVRDAQVEKIPYMITLGDKEEENKTQQSRPQEKPNPTTKRR